MTLTCSYLYHPIIPKRALNIVLLSGVSLTGLSLPDTSLWEPPHSWTWGRSYTPSWAPEQQGQSQSRERLHSPLYIPAWARWCTALVVPVGEQPDGVLKTLKRGFSHHLLANLSGDVPAGFSWNNFTFLSQELSAVLPWDVSIQGLYSLPIS